MKTYNKTYLPETIIYNGLEYKRNESVNILHVQNITLNNYIETMKKAGFKAVLCNVLSRNLKGKTDLHGQLYKPNQWVFLHKKN